jgi:hypothetical protein
MGTAPNKRMQLTKHEHIGASQLIRSVRQTNGPDIPSGGAVEYGSRRPQRLGSARCDN